MKEKKVFRELTEDQLGLVIGGARRFTGVTSCENAGGTTECVEGVGMSCIIDGGSYPIGLRASEGIGLGCVMVD